ncbi:MAG: thioredoxin domain-containing protein, partial [Salegentibacter mishustinae]|nr:thioredoxin domain-containing protein [Salegentibacter mishustinae]
REYYDLANKMLKTVQPQIKTYPQSYANWLDLMLNFVNPFYEVAITGKNAISIKKELEQEFLPHTIFAGGVKASEISILKNRFKNDKDLIYICSDAKCDLPKDSVEESIKTLKQF